MKTVAFVYILSLTLLVTLSCFRHINPLDMHGDNYDPPRVFISAPDLAKSDSTAADSLSVAFTGNRPEVEIRYRIDSLVWSAWEEQGSKTIGGFSGGLHTISIQGRYGEGGDTAETSMHFVKTAMPSIAAGILCNGRKGERYFLLYDSLYTLSIQSSGTPLLTYIWYKDTMILDTTDTCIFTIDSFTIADTGNYTCKVLNHWGTATSSTAHLSALSLPAAQRDTFTTIEDSACVKDSLFGVLANDSAEGKGALVAELLDSTRHGSVMLHKNGGFVYTPAVNYYGADTFCYRAVNAAGNGSKRTTAIITILPLNDAPVALDDSFSVKEDAMLLVDSTHGVMANDYDVDSRITGTKAITATRHGKLLFTEQGSFTYVPDTNFFGSDSFSYLIKDAENASSDTAWVHITILPVNDPPFIVNHQKQYTLAENGQLAITRQMLLVNDIDNDSTEISFEIKTIPLHGSLLKKGTTLKLSDQFTQKEVNDSIIAYRQNGDEEATDRFMLAVSDGAGGKIDSMVFAFDILPVNDTPSIGTQGEYKVIRRLSAPLSASALAISDPDNTPGELNVHLVAAPRHGNLALSGTRLKVNDVFTLYDVNKQLVIYQNDSSTFASDTFSFNVADIQNAESPVAAFIIAVDPGRPVVSKNSVADTGYMYDEETITVYGKDTNGTIRHWAVQWESGKGFETRENDGKFTHVFNDTGLYRIRMYVVDDEGLPSDTITHPVYIKRGEPVFTSVHSLTPENKLFVNDMIEFKVKGKDPNGSVDSLVVWVGGDTVKAPVGVSVKGDSALFTCSFKPKEAGAYVMRMRFIDNHDIFTDTVFTMSIRQGTPVITRVWCDSATLWVNDRYRYHVSAYDTNGTIRKFYADWSGGSAVNDSIVVPAGRQSVDTFFTHAYDTASAGSRAAQFRAVDEDGVVSDGQNTTVVVHKGAPVIWGDSEDTIWVVVDKGYGDYYYRPHYLDSNGVIDTFYFGRDVESVSLANKKYHIDSTLYQVNSSTIHNGTDVWIWIKDDDGYLAKRRFVVYADSASPATIVSAVTWVGDYITIYWKEKDVKDGDSTHYRVLLHEGSEPDSSRTQDIVSGWSSGYRVSDLPAYQYMYRFKLIPSDPFGSLIYYYKVQARDLRKTVTDGSGGHTFSY